MRKLREGHYLRVDWVTFALTVPVLPLVAFSGAWIWLQMMAPMQGVSGLRPIADVRSSPSALSDSHERDDARHSRSSWRVVGWLLRKAGLR